MSKVSKADIIQYMIDCLGYPDDDLEYMSTQELAYMLTADELAECYTFTNK